MPPVGSKMSKPYVKSYKPQFIPSLEAPTSNTASPSPRLHWRGNITFLSLISCNLSCQYVDICPHDTQESDLEESLIKAAFLWGDM